MSDLTRETIAAWHDGKASWSSPDFYLLCAWALERDAEATEMQYIFDLQEKADRIAIDAWQAEDPKGRERQWPGRVEMVTWLINRAEAAETEAGLRCAQPGVASCARQWEADHQRAALDSLGLADEFNEGCDAIHSVSDALVASRVRVKQLELGYDELRTIANRLQARAEAAEAKLAAVTPEEQRAR